MSVIRSDVDRLWSKYGSHVSRVENGKFTVLLNRTAVFKSVITNVLQEATHYGQVLRTSDIRRIVMINYGGLMGLVQSLNHTDLSLGKLRLLLVGQLLQSLLSLCR